MTSATSAPSIVSERRQRLLDACIPYLRADGFGPSAIRAGASALGMSEAEASLLCPNKTSDLAALLFSRFDAAAAVTVEGLKIRERIGLQVHAWLDAAAADDALAHRLCGHLALPGQVALGQSLMWASADAIWRRAGDRALDFNHYSKRIIVSGMLTTAFLTRLSRGRDAQLEQISRNIDQVMAFEKWKAGVKFSPEAAMQDAAAILGRLRFGTTRG